MLKLTQAFPRRLKISTDRVMWAAVLGSCFLIVQATLTPYHFQFVAMLNTFGAGGLIMKFVGGPSDPADMINNVVLFLPLGFCLAWLLQRRQHTGLLAAAAPLFVGAGLSLAVEVLQLFLPTRTSTPIDVLTNSLGTLLGLLIVYGIRLVFRSPTNLMITLTGWLIAAFAVTVPLQSGARLTNWDPTFPLQIGTKGTPEWSWSWKGQVFDVAIADTALTESQVQALVSGAQPLASFNNTFRASYQFIGTGSYPDRTGTLPDLVWKGATPQEQAGTGVTVADDRWLETLAPAASLTQRVAQTSQFTLITTVATGDSKQEGPIVALVGDLAHQNFTLGQEQDHLTFFLRTPISGESASEIPELFVPEVFADTRPHQVIVTYNRGTFQFYIDGVRQPHAQIITPEYTFFGYLLPPQIASWMQHKLLNPDERYALLYKLLYESLLFLPLGLLLALVMRYLPSVVGPRLRGGLLVTGIILPAVLLEAERVLAGGQTMQWINLARGLILIGCSWMFFRARIVSWGRYRQKEMRSRAGVQPFGHEMARPTLPE